jgi:hypothetical protein
MRYNEDVKETGMPKRSPSQQVPKDMQARFDEITQLTDTFSHTYLNEEYGQLCRELTATLCRKRPSAARARQGQPLGVWDHSCTGYGQLSL